MTIEAATGILTLLGGVGLTFLSLFVSNKIRASEEKITDKIERTYITKEFVIARLTDIERRIGDLEECGSQ